MEDLEPLRVKVEVDGKKEFRPIDRVEPGRWDLPRLIPKLNPGETLVDTLAGYKIFSKANSISGKSTGLNNQDSPTISVMNGLP